MMGHTTQRAPGKDRLLSESDSGGNPYASRNTRVKYNAKDMAGTAAAKSANRGSGSRRACPNTLKNPHTAPTKPACAPILTAR